MSDNNHLVPYMSPLFFPSPQV